MAHEVRKSMEKDDDGMLTREEKEALLDRKIQMMKLKNEERMKKFKEIEEDKKWAEREGCAVSLKTSSTFNDGDDAWPLRPDRFPEEGPEEQVDLRKVLQQRKGDSRTPQDQPVPSRQQGSSKYASILEDGPPPDPVYNYLADHVRDKPVGEKVRRSPRGHLGPRNNGTRVNRPRHDQFSGQPHKYNGDDSLHEENSAGYDHWRKERENIDRERIERQKTNEGWKREWDRDKAETQKEQRSYRQAGHQSLEESHAPPPSSGDSYARGTSYRGGRGRGRPKQDLRGSSPRAGLTPEREFETTVQEPPRFRRSPEDSRPGALAQANSRGSSVGNSPRNWPNAQRPVTSGQSQQQWPHPKTGANIQAFPPDSGVMPSSRNTDFSSKNSIVITVGNRQPQAENGVQPIIRVIQNDAQSRQEKPIKSEVELLARDQFVKCPKKGIGSGRLLPPSKERVAAVRGKNAVRKIVTTKGKRSGSRWVEKDDEPVTIGIAVITTPGDKEENVAKKVESDSGKISPVVEEKHTDVIPPKKDVSKSEAVTRPIEFVDDEADNYDDDDDDEWEDIDGSWADVDEKIGGEHNKSNESIDRFIEENTLHPDGTNWNIDDDTADIPWSEQVDAESQERHHMENEWGAAKQRPSDSNLDYQSSCSIVESPFEHEQSEILSSLLAAACDPFAKEELDLKPASETSCTESKADVARDLSPSDARPNHDLPMPAGEESCSESSKAATPTGNDFQQDTIIGLSSESQPSSSLADISPSTAFAPVVFPLQSVSVETSDESQFPLVVTEQPNSESSVSAELVCSQPESMQSAVFESNSSDASAVLDGKATLSAISEPSLATDTSAGASATATQFAASEQSDPADTSTVPDAEETLSAISEPSHATDTSTEASATATQFATSEPSGTTDKPFEQVTLDLSALKPEPATGLMAGIVHQSASETILSQPEGLQSHSEEVTSTCLSVGSALLPLQSAEETQLPQSSHTDEKNSEVNSAAVQER